MPPPLALLAILIGPSLAAAATAAPWLARATPTISIDAGALAGTTTSLPGATATALKFLGVPFARSPPTRFAPAERPAAWGASGRVRAAKGWRDGCVQQFVGAFFFSGRPEGEV
jgi:hypothetical protein